MIATATPEEIKRRLDAGEPLELIDVREHDEIAIAAIEGARVLPMSQAAAWIDHLPGDRELVIGLPPRYAQHAGGDGAGAARPYERDEYDGRHRPVVYAGGSDSTAVLQVMWGRQSCLQAAFSGGLFAFCRLAGPSKSRLKAVASVMARIGRPHNLHASFRRLRCGPQLQPPSVFPSPNATAIAVDRSASRACCWKAATHTTLPPRSTPALPPAS